VNNVTNDPAGGRTQDLRDRNKRRDVDTRRSVQRAEAAKTARVRELHLAKAAADREVAKRTERSSRAATAFQAGESE
jgi:hypothetical protein